MNRQLFQELVWQKGRDLYRDMPWRDQPTPYYVLVSELMLQQTQVDRVIPKFQAFIQQFPTIKALASAPLADVLRAWSGLGYNRRAKFLHEAAKKVMIDFDGDIPATLLELISLPGVGPNTAGAIVAYGYNQPVVFIETNIRTIYFHHFFGDATDISDADLRVIVADTIDTEHPREWYWALMDYGAYLKKQGLGLIDKSRHYKKQSPLKGSLREIRGLILKALADRDWLVDELVESLPKKDADDDRFATALAALRQEGIIVQTGKRLHLP